MQSLASDRLTRPVLFEQHDLAHRKMFGKKFFALFPDMGTAKSFMLLREMLAMWQADMVDGLLVVSPIDVHVQWVDEEIPNTTSQKIIAAAWPNRAPIEPSEYPRVFTIYPEAFRRSALRDKRGRKRKDGKLGRVGAKVSPFAECLRFLQSGRMGLVIDESQMIMNVSSRTARRVKMLKPHARYRRIASGFPNPKGLIDLFSQYNFLNTRILQCKTKGQFIDRYCELGGFKGKAIVGYKNEEDFNRRVAPYTYTVQLEDCMDMPERTWVKLPVSLTSEQERLIIEIKKQFRATLEEERILMPLALQRLTRMQQVTCGFLPRLDELGKTVLGIQWIPENRTRALENAMQRIRGKAIVWSRFKPCIDRLTKHFGDIAVAYQGGMTRQEKREAKDSFMRDPKVRIIFAQPKSAGAGFNGLTVARYSLYWSNSFDAQQRRQTERRIWRIGQDRHCVYGDFVAQGTPDQKIREVLMQRQNVAQGILSDIASWKA